MTVILRWAGLVAEILLDRPEKRNALTPEMLDSLGLVLAEIASSDARVAVIRGAGDKAFCAGADITRFAGLSPELMWRDWTARGHRVFDALAALPQPTVAVVHGNAFGGGLELALACDFRLLAPEVTLGLPEVGLGTVPGWGGTERLTQLVGPARAKEIILSRRLVDADTAVAWGLATAVSGSLDAAVDELVTRLTGGAPIAVQVAKQLIDAAAAGAPARVLEPLAGALSSATSDLAEGVAAFRERRDPVFTGH
ncbi:enoyl-CoA hydratase/isomerase family protein [Amycolatopsis jejuensis]|uniref:enoyl-CoA hydratase/isomerase family protein n=1 Tax=Amycolatopsis jejuensis TaxID=330084 RepID=UPI000526C49C|nr:enoyl-CoA hydratase-related protein [Amycolatopsis jejuensis]